MRTPIVRLPRKEISEKAPRETGGDWDFGTFRVYFTCKLETIRVCKICVGSGDGEDDGVGLCDVLEDHVLDLFLDILWLITDRDLCETGEIDEGEGKDVGREDSEVDGSRGNARVLSCFLVCFSDDFIAYFAKVVELLAWKMEELSPLVSVVCVVSLFVDFDSICGI